jgi:FMN phosphatase YigB (HAD superfamily)
MIQAQTITLNDGKKLKYGKVVIFDLFGTLVKDISNEYKKGFEWLKNEIMPEECKIEDVLRIAEQFRRIYMKNRLATHKEASHLRQLEFLKSEIGFRKEKLLDEIEYEFFNASRVTEPQDGVFELLPWLKEQGYSLYVMSNTIYSAKTIKKHLEALNLADYFNGIYTSADCGYRKPGQKFFSSVFNEIKKTVSVKKSEVIFIGNSLEKDMIGAKKFGFIPVWLSSTTGGFGEYITDCIRVNDFFECKQFFENNYIRIAKVPKDYSVADGIGNRIVVYMQGCNKHCSGCHNQSTWDFFAGKIYSIKELMTEILSHMSIGTKNVTISGGEPLDQPKPLMTFLKALKQADIDVCLYTGHDFDDVSDKIRDNIHYLKTGPYVHGLRTTEKGFYGSTNQKFWEKGEEGVWVQKI